METIRSFSTVSRPHISLDVADLEKSKAFYEAFFGVAPSKVREGYAKFEVADPPLNLALNQRPTGEPVPARGGAAHFGVEVKSTEIVKAGLARLTAAGLNPIAENGTCCFAEQAKLWVTDPDGNPWEIFVVLADEERRGQSIAVQACCPS